MANRFWVGGTGTWVAGTLTPWAATSGGAGGQSVPTIADDVIFDANSGGGTVTVGGNMPFRSLTTTSGYTGLLTGAGVARAMTCATSVSIASPTHLGNFINSTFTFTGTTDNGGVGWPIVTNGANLNAVNVNGVGGKWQLQDALTNTAGFTITNGHLDTNSMTVQSSTLTIAAGTKALTLGSTKWTVTGASAITVTTAGLTLNVGTSEFIYQGTGGTLNLGAIQWNDLKVAPLVNAAVVLNSSGTTFNNLRYILPTAVGTGGAELRFPSVTVVNGTFEAKGYDPSWRGLIKSNTPGTQRSITVNGTIDIEHMDIQDITFTGAAVPGGVLDLSAKNVGDAMGNSAITFPPSQLNLFRPPASSNVSRLWSDPTNWSLGRTPRPHDDMAWGPNPGGTWSVSADVSRLCRNLDTSAYTRTFTLALTNLNTIFGSVNLGGHIVGGGIWLTGRGSHTIQSNGWQIMMTPNRGFDVGDTGVAAGSYTLLDSAYIGQQASSGQDVQINSRLNLNGFSHQFSTGSGGIIVGSVGTLDFGGSTVLHTISPATALGPSFSVTLGGLVLNAEAAIYRVMNEQAQTRGFAGGGYRYGEVDLGTQYLTQNITGDNSFGKLKLRGTAPLVFAAGSINSVDDLDIDGVDIGALDVTIGKLANSRAITSDSPALSITGDIAMWGRVRRPDWTLGSDRSIIMKGDVGTESYQFYVTGGGGLGFAWYEAGGTFRNAGSTLGVPVPDGDVCSLGVELDVDNGAAGRTIKFYYSLLENPGPADWLPLGVPVVQAGVTSVRDTAAQLSVGGSGYGTSNFAGYVERAVVKSGSLAGGVVQFDASFSSLHPSVTSFVESSANAATVTLAGQASLGGRPISSSVSGSPAFIFKPAGTTEVRYASLKDIWGTVVTQRSAASNDIADTRNSTVTLERSPQAGRRMVAIVASAGSTLQTALANIVMPAGWVNTDFYQSSAASISIWEKVAGVNEPRVITATSGSAGATGSMAVYVMSGDTGLDEHMTETSGASVTTMALGPLTTIGDDRLLLAAVSGSGALSTTTWPAPWSPMTVSRLLTAMLADQDAGTYNVSPVWTTARSTNVGGIYAFPRGRHGHFIAYESLDLGNNKGFNFDGGWIKVKQNGVIKRKIIEDITGRPLTLRKGPAGALVDA